MTTVSGNEGATILTAAASGDTLTGLGGNDSLSGNGGNATLDGGTGDDLLIGGRGTDSYRFGLRRSQGLRGQRPVLRPVLRPEAGHAPGAALKASQPRGFAHAP